jgi:hypothetical protein
VFRATSRGIGTIMKIPVINLELNQPTRGSLAWYASLTALSATGLIEWPLAAVVAAGHLISENSHSEAVSGAAEGAESAAG